MKRSFDYITGYGVWYSAQASLRDNGAQRGARTHDPDIKSLMLYRLRFLIQGRGSFFIFKVKNKVGKRGPCGACANSRLFILLPSSMSVPNFERIDLFVQKLSGGSQHFEIGSRDPGNVHLRAIYATYAGRSVLHLRTMNLIAQFGQKLLMLN